MSGLPTPEQLQALPPAYLAEDIGPRLMTASIAFITIISIVFALFMTSRLFFVDRNPLHTWILYPLSYMFTLVQCILCVYFVKSAGAGRHIAYWLINDPSTIGNFLKLQTASETIYMAAITLPKVTVLLLYLSIFTERKVRIACWVIMGIVVAHYIAVGIVVFFSICQPFAFKWDKTIPDGRCGDLIASYKYISIPNILTDLAILILPFSSLIKLQVGTSRKVGIFVTFLAGSLGIVGAIIRMVGFYTTDISTDLTFYGVDTMLYTMMEPCAYFICSCLPGIRPLVRAGCQKSGLTDALSSIYGKSTSSRSNRSGRRAERSSIGHGNSSHVTSVTACKKHLSKSNDYDMGFIRLEESVCVESKSIASSTRDLA